MILYILISLFILLFTWILVGPVIFSLNTDRNHYQLLLPGVINAKVVPSMSMVYLRGWLLFIPFRIEVSKFRRGKGKKRSAKRRGRKKTKRKARSIKMVSNVTGAFHIRKLWMDLDTDNFMWNAWLIPVFSVLNNHRNIRMQVNFEGHLKIDLDLRTRTVSLLWAILKNR